MQTQALPFPPLGDTESTKAFIASLVDAAPAKRRYFPPATYLVLWLLGSLTYVLVIANGLLDVRFDLAFRLKDLTFLSTVGFMALGSITFAYSSLVSSLPAHKDYSIYFGVGSTFVWVGLLIYGVACDLPALLEGQMFFHFDQQVFVALLLAGTVPLLFLWLIVRRLAPFNAGKVALAMSLASFMLAATVLRFFYVSLYNGTDCSLSLFFWMLIPLILSSGFGTVSVAPFVRSWLPRLKVTNN